MENTNQEIIQHYEQYIKEVESMINKIDNDKLLERRQRNRLIAFLEKVIFHCKGMVSVLDGTYHTKKKGDFKYEK